MENQRIFSVLQMEKNLMNQTKFKKMDMEKPLQFDGEYFGIDTDSDFYNSLFQCKHEDGQWGDVLNKPHEFSHSYHETVQKLKLSASLSYTPMNELLEMAEAEHGSEDFNRVQMKRILKKSKLIEKRQKAKKRQKNSNNMYSFNPFIVQTPNFQICSDAKKQKNRLSAQVSRDKKKQYYNMLERQNKIQKQQIQRLTQQNKELSQKIEKNKNILPSENKFITFLIFLGLIFFVDLLKASFTKRKSAYEMMAIPKISLKCDDKMKIEEQLSEMGMDVNLDSLGSVEEKGKYVPKQIAFAIRDVASTYL